MAGVLPYATRHRLSRHTRPPTLSNVGKRPVQLERMRTSLSDLVGFGDGIGVGYAFCRLSPVALGKMWEASHPSRAQTHPRSEASGPHSTGLGAMRTRTGDHRHLNRGHLAVREPRIKQGDFLRTDRCKGSCRFLDADDLACHWGRILLHSLGYHGIIRCIQHGLGVLVGVAVMLLGGSQGRMAKPFLDLQ